MNDHGIGKHCSDQTCKQVDWMPLMCKYCNKFYCADHSSIESHNCPQFHKSKKEVYVCPLCNKVLEINQNLTVEGNFSVHEATQCQKQFIQKEVPTCNWKKCQKKITELNEYVCRRCRKKYCLKHRMEDDHDCLNCF